VASSRVNITLHYIILHYITVHYIKLRYITLHYITLHYITLTRAGCLLPSLRNSSSVTFARTILEFRSTDTNNFFGVTTPKRKRFVCHSFNGVLVWRKRVRRGGDGNLLLYALYEDCCKRTDNTAPDHAFLFRTQILDVHEL